MPKKKQLSDSERELLRNAMEGVTPLRHGRVPPHQNKPDAAEVMQRETAAVMHELATSEGVDYLEVGEGLAFLRPGLQQRTLRDLRRGKYVIQGELDLHSLTRDQAYQAILSFLPQCLQQRLRCIRIIHGKGLGSYNKQPVLKSCVAKWLTRFDAVLAFCSAPPADGGTGAVYVLLKKAKP